MAKQTRKERYLAAQSELARLSDDNYGMTPALSCVRRAVMVLLNEAIAAEPPDEVK